MESCTRGERGRADLSSLERLIFETDCVLREERTEVSRRRRAVADQRERAGPTNERHEGDSGVREDVKGMTPEVARGFAATSDVWALGCTAHELPTGWGRGGGRRGRPKGRLGGRPPPGGKVEPPGGS